MENCFLQLNYNEYNVTRNNGTLRPANRSHFEMAFPGKMDRSLPAGMKLIFNFRDI